MTTSSRRMRKCAVALAMLASACTVTDTTPPPLAGPSEMSLSLAISANPDTLSIDGASQSQIAIDARDANGQPAANVTLRLEIDGGDFGTLSSRTVVTGGNGRAVFTYTAPPANSADQSSEVSINVTPAGTDFAAAVPRVVTLQLVPRGTVNPGGASAAFTFAPAAPAAFESVRFDASTSRASRGGAILSYFWEFGDGGVATTSQPSATYEYDIQGSYRARVTITDSNGVVATSAFQTINVGAPDLPVASFVFSPTEPVAGTAVFFNAAQSRAGRGHSVVAYAWDFGDGTPGSSGITASHTYATAGTYVVVLTITDEMGQRAVATREVEVQ